MAAVTFVFTLVLFVQVACYVLPKCIVHIHVDIHVDIHGEKLFSCAFALHLSSVYPTRIIILDHGCTSLVLQL